MLWLPMQPHLFVTTQVLPSFSSPNKLCVRLSVCLFVPKVLIYPFGTASCVMQELLKCLV